MNKRGEYDISSLLPIAITFVVGVIAFTIGGDVIEDIRPTPTDDGLVGNNTIYNMSSNGIKLFGEIGTWFPTVGLVLAAALIIGILISSFKY